MKIFVPGLMVGATIDTLLEGGCRAMISKTTKKALGE
jgi:hypothetical protein